MPADLGVPRNEARLQSVEAMIVICLWGQTGFGIRNCFQMFHLLCWYTWHTSYEDLLNAEHFTEARAARGRELVSFPGLKVAQSGSGPKHLQFGAVNRG